MRVFLLRLLTRRPSPLAAPARLPAASTITALDLLRALGCDE
jgi:hypothetical protein